MHLKNINIRLILFLLSLLLLFWLIIGKFIRAYQLDYQSDIIIHLQMSRNWFYGWPLFFDNAYGNHGQIHNYLINPLFGLFTIPFQINGFFIFQLISYSLSIFSIYKYQKSNDKGEYSILIYLLLLGPIGIYLLENPGYGWQIEQAFIPAALLFSFGILWNKPILKFSGIIAVLLIKEEGPVLAASLHLFSILSNDNFKNSYKKALLILSVYIAIFILGLLWLKINNAGGESRIDFLLNKINNPEDFNWAPWLKIFSIRFLLTSIPLFLFLRIFGSQKTLWAMVLAIPILLINIISGLAYFPDPNFSLLWTPRLSLAWAYWLGVFIISWKSIPAFKFNLKDRFAVLILLIIIPYYLFNEKENPQFWKYNQEAVLKEGPLRSDIHQSNIDINYMRLLNQYLNPQTNIETEAWTMAAFSRHNCIWPGKAWGSVGGDPDLIIKIKGQKPEEKFLNYQLKPGKDFDFYFNPKIKVPD